MKTNYLKKAEEALLCLIFPDECLVCHRDGFLVCPDCEKNISIRTEQVCPICEDIFTDSGKLCHRCKQNNNFIQQLIVASEYKDTELPRIIFAYKYKFISDLSLSLGRVMTKALLRNNVKIPDFIVPVPLHPFRLRWRGFNQAKLLANYVSQNLLPGIAIPVFENLIIRGKFTPPQMGIKNYTQRQKNLEEAFEINRKLSPAQINLIKRKNILLVDDVCTTGSTIFNCAKLLKTLSPRTITGAVLARQRMD